MMQNYHRLQTGAMTPVAKPINIVSEDRKKENLTKADKKDRRLFNKRDFPIGTAFACNQGTQ
jgi:hypothetical protein